MGYGPRTDFPAGDDGLSEACVKTFRVLSGIVWDLTICENGPDPPMLHKLLHYLWEADRLHDKFRSFAKVNKHHECPQDVMTTIPDEKEKRIKVLKNPFTAHEILSYTFHNAAFMMLKIAEGRNNLFPVQAIPQNIKSVIDQIIGQTDPSPYRLMKAEKPRWTTSESPPSSPLDEQDNRPAEVKKWWPNPIGGYHSIYDLSWLALRDVKGLPVVQPLPAPAEASKEAESQKDMR